MLQKLGRGLSTDCITKGTTGTGFLDDVISSVCCDLDATIAASYTSGQTWANLIETPADGTGQTYYDFWLGVDGSATATDPTFTGSADDPAAYFAHDGGDYFRAKDLTGTALNKSGMTSGTGTGPVWIAVAFKLGSVDANISPWGDNTAQPGAVRALMSSTENMRFVQRSSSASYNQEIIPAATFDATTDFLVIITYDTTSAGSEKYWVNSTTGANWATAYSPVTNTTEYTGDFDIAAAAGSFVFPNGSKTYHFSCGNELLDDAKATDIFTHLEARHSRNYTP